MVKISFAVLFAVMALGTNQAYADMCDDFKTSVKVEVLTQNISVQAGTEVKLPVKIAIGEDEARRWKFINLSTGLYNDIEGSRSSIDTFSLKFGDGGLEIPTEFSYQTTTAMGGAYKVGVMIYAQDKSYQGPCVIRVDPLPNLNVSISNQPENVDIDPPVLKTASFKQEAYKAGDTLEIAFQADDKSEICTVWKEQAGVCHSGTHFELQAVEGAETISFHTPTPIFKTKDPGSYLAVVPLSEEYATKDIKPGIYKVVHFMFRDIHGNSYDKLPSGLEIKVEFK